VSWHTAELAAACPPLPRVHRKRRHRYDAVNRGYRRAQGDIPACLYCDEQSLAGVSAEISLLPVTNGIYHAAPYDESRAGKTVSIRPFFPG
jgi:hypothetical protein